MENKIYYTAIKRTIDYYRTKEKSEAGFYIVKEEFDALGIDAEQYYEEIDYKKIFLRSYYKRYSDTSPSFDFDGKEINFESRLVADIMFMHLLDQFSDKAPIYKYKCSGDISLYEYQKLLEEHNLL